jgi:hypothetical protein
MTRQGETTGFVPPAAVDEGRAPLAEALTNLATKEEGYGMAYHARGISGRAEIHLYGKRAEAAHWLMNHGVEALSTGESSARPLMPPTKRKKCIIPPKGWLCTRVAGHEGPCAAVPQSAVERALEQWSALPDDERNGERPFIMGFNAGWDEALAASPEQPASEAVGACDCAARFYGDDRNAHQLCCAALAERSTRGDGNALAKFDAGACRVGWMRDRLPEAAIRIDEMMPPRDTLVVGWISDPAVSIWFYPAFVRFDGHCFWGGVPGNWMRLPDKRWAVTHWHPLALAHPAESANCPVGGEAAEPREMPMPTEIVLLREALAIYGDRQRMATSCRPELQQVIDIALEAMAGKVRPSMLASSDNVGIPPAGAGDVGALRIVRDEAVRALQIVRDHTDAENPVSYRSDDREGCLDAVYSEAQRALDYIAKVEGGTLSGDVGYARAIEDAAKGTTVANATIAASKRISGAIRALSARKDAAIEGGER